MALLNARTLQQPLPAALERGVPTNVIASALMLEALGNVAPERLALLKRRVEEGTAEMTGINAIFRWDRGRDSGLPGRA